MTSPNPVILEARDLRKRFPRAAKPALNGVSFSVNRGEIFGLLGHNGAGKSTTLGIMLGMVAPTGGDVVVDGHSVQKERAAALRKVGAIFEAPAFYDYMSGWDNLRFLTSLSGLTTTDGFDEIVELVGLSERIHSEVRTYSHGMRQRLGVAQALLPKPEILLLDEPTDGLDPEGIREFRELVIQLRDEKGLTILLNSHLLSEVEQVCDRFAILKAGNLIYEGGAEDLDPGTIRFKVEVDDWEKAKGLIQDGGGEVDTNESGIFHLPKQSDPAEINAALVGGGLRVRTLAEAPRSLEDLYLEVTNR